LTGVFLLNPLPATMRGGPSRARSCPRDVPVPPVAVKLLPKKAGGGQSQTSQATLSGLARQGGGTQLWKLCL